MCERITQYANSAEYAAALGWTGLAPQALAQPESAGFNIAPGAHPRVMHRLNAGARRIDRMRWGQVCSTPGQAREHDLKVQTAATSPCFERLWREGRCIVPAEGWYEWQGEGRNRQPFRIHLPDDAPMFLAAIADYRPGAPVDAQGGFLLVTAQAGNGLLDMHDHRPVVLAAEDAHAWMDPATSPEAARLIAVEMLLPPPAFLWHPVSKAVQDRSFDCPQALEPVIEPAA